MNEAQQLLQTANAYLDLVVGLAEVRSSGMGEQHPSVSTPRNALERFRQNHPDLPQAVLEKVAEERISGFNEELSRLEDNGLGAGHPMVLAVKAKIDAVQAILSP